MATAKKAAKKAPAKKAAKKSPTKKTAAKKAPAKKAAKKAAKKPAKKAAKKAGKRPPRRRLRKRLPRRRPRRPRRKRPPRRRPRRPLRKRPPRRHQRRRPPRRRPRRPGEEGGRRRCAAGRSCGPGQDGSEPASGLAVSDGKQALRTTDASASVDQTRLRPGFFIQGRICVSANPCDGASGMRFGLVFGARARLPPRRPRAPGCACGSPSVSECSAR